MENYASIDLCWNTMSYEEREHMLCYKDTAFECLTGECAIYCMSIVRLSQRLDFASAHRRMMEDCIDSSLTCACHELAVGLLETHRPKC